MKQKFVLSIVKYKNGRASALILVCRNIILVCRNIIATTKLAIPPRPTGSLTQTIDPANRGALERFTMSFCSLLAVVSLLALWIQPLHADPQDDSFLSYAVNIAMPTWKGNGIYLGKGLFLTVAHVIGRGWLTRPKIVLQGQTYPTRVVKEGSSDDVDLALLAVEENLLPMRLRLRKNPLCTASPRPGQEVITVVPDAVVHSHIVWPERLPPNLRKFTSVIGDVATTGNSGSGVFDPRQRCLLGIVSQKFSQSVRRDDTGKAEIRDIAKYFIPASTIAAFMPAEFRSLDNQ
jgi:hypothetical protein